jgi:predicted nuclease of restriction endonuclease-like (RecB) superfamily
MAAKRKKSPIEPKTVAPAVDLSLVPAPSSRLSRGRTRDEAIMPVAPARAVLSAGYVSLLADIKKHLAQARLRTVLAANVALTQAYWQIGQTILARQEAEGWGAKVIDRLSADLREAFPDMGGLSPRNLLAMKLFAQAFPKPEITQQPVAKLPWGHILLLLQKVKSKPDRLWYIGASIEYGWSRNVLALQIAAHAHVRSGKSVNNFAATLPPADSDLANQIFKDPYLFDFLGTADSRREREVEQALVDHIQKFLLELGSGFAFVGRQVHLEVGNSDSYIDLLFYHLKLRRYIVVELKAVAFEPGFTGQMNFYLSAVDDLLRHPEDQPTIGLLLCKSKTKLEVEYALRGLDKSIAVSDWKTRLTETLPRELRGSLPTVAELEAELTEDFMPSETKRKAEP